MNPPSSRHRARGGTACLLIAIVLAAGVASGCAGSDDGRVRASRDSSRATAAEVVPFAQWSSRVDTACAAAERQFSRVRENVPTTAAEAVEQSVDIDRFANAILASVDDEGSPEGHESSAELLRSRLVEMSAQTEQLASAADHGDVTAVRAAIEEITTLGGEINPLTAELAVPACGGF